MVQRSMLGIAMNATPNVRELARCTQRRTALPAAVHAGRVMRRPEARGSKLEMYGDPKVNGAMTQAAPSTISSSTAARNQLTSRS